MAASLTDYRDGFVAQGYTSGSTIGPVSVLGGRYNFVVHDTSTPSCVLQVKAADGSYVDFAAAIVANGAATYDLAPGGYQVIVTTGAALAASLIHVPLRQA